MTADIGTHEPPSIAGLGLRVLLRYMTLREGTSYGQRLGVYSHLPKP